MEQKENIILKLTFAFALKIIAFSEVLDKDRKYAIAKQILRSGTSIGANSNEAQDSESKADFIHKLKIAAKEARETKYWLELCKHSESYPFDEALLSDLEAIQKVLNKIISTTKNK